MRDYKKLIESIEGVKKVDRRGETSYTVEIEPLPDDEEAIIELTLVTYDTKDPQSIPNLWYKRKFTDKIFKSVVWISACITTHGTKKYGIDPLSLHHKIFFENLREVSEENIKEMVELTIKKYRGEEVIYEQNFFEW